MVSTTKKIIILFTVFFIFVSCDLSKKSIFDQVGDFEKIDYNDKSPIRRGSVRGLAIGSDGTLFIVSSLRLWKKEANSEWTDLTNSLPGSFSFASDIVQLGSNTYILATNSNTNLLGLLELDTTNSNITISKTKNSQQPIKFFKEVNADGKISQAYIYSIDTASNKYVYDINLSEITPKDANQQRPNSLAKVIGPLSSSSFIVKTYNQIGEQEGQIWTSSGSPIVKIEPNYEIFVVGKSNIQGSQKLGVGIRSGAFLEINPSTGKINDLENEFVKGFSSSVIPSFLSYIDNTSVIATDTFGYFENSEGKQLAYPTSKTTDTASYSANRLSTTNIEGIYILSDGNVYIATSGSGAWVRDNTTKKWSGI